MLGRIKEIYKTTDNRIFENRKEAENHQNELNYKLRRENFILYDSLVEEYKNKSMQELQDLIGEIVPISRHSIFNNDNVHNRVRPYYCNNFQQEDLYKIVTKNVLKIQLIKNPDYLQIVKVNDFIHIYYKGNYNIINSKGFIRKEGKSKYINFSAIKNDKRIDLSNYNKANIYKVGDLIFNEKNQQLFNLSNQKSARRLTVNEWIGLSEYFE